MNDVAKVPVKRAEQGMREPAALPMWRPFDDLRREVDRLFTDFDQGLSPMTRRPLFGFDDLWRRRGGASALLATPAVDVVEKDDAYVVSAELPGMDNKDIEVEVANDRLTLRGEKQEAREEKKGGYHLQERRYGSFERSFRLPEGVDAAAIDAGFAKGVLTVTLPKTAEARKATRKIEVKGT